MDDVCPICKSSRYLNPNMKFLVNPECYHKMCESCVARIFTLGPAPCPYPDCHKTLRKIKFVEQVFEDLGVEREVNVRKRVTMIFNRMEDDFDSLEQYNDYLEQIEDIVFNLVNGVNVEQTEEKLKAYELENREKILANVLRQRQENEQLDELEKYDKENRQKAYQYAVQEQEEEERIKQEIQQETERELATGQGDAAVIVQRVQDEAAKRLSERRQQLLNSLKPKRRLPSKIQLKVAEEPVVPFTPFNGDRQREYVFSVADNYFDPLLQDLGQDLAYTACGFSVKNAYRQALVQAFMGLDCNVRLEKAAAAASQ